MPSSFVCISRYAIYYRTIKSVSADLIRVFSIGAPLVAAVAGDYRVQWCASRNTAKLFRLVDAGVQAVMRQNEIAIDYPRGQYRVPGIDRPTNV